MLVFISVVLVLRFFKKHGFRESCHKAVVGLQSTGGQASGSERCNPVKYLYNSGAAGAGCSRCVHVLCWDLGSLHTMSRGSLEQT